MSNMLAVAGVRNCEPCEMSNEELVIAKAWLQLLVGQISENGDEVPSELKSRLEAANYEHTHRNRNKKLDRLEQLKLRQQSLMTREQKAKETATEIARLEAELSVGQAASQEASARRGPTNRRRRS